MQSMARALLGNGVIEDSTRALVRPAFRVVRMDLADKPGAGICRAENIAICYSRLPTDSFFWRFRFPLLAALLLEGVRQPRYWDERKIHVDQD